MATLHEVDVAVIGAGSAGLAARRIAEKEGASTVLIEAGAQGTTCARVGCMPSKLLIAAADAAHGMRRAGMFGVEAAGGVHVDGPAVLARVRRERDRFVALVTDAVERIAPEHQLAGRARFVGPSALMVDEHTRVEAKAVVIATGASPWLPPPLRAVADRMLTHESVFELADVPASLAVVGTGIIGLELGQALARLGSKVVFFNDDSRLGPITDPTVRAVMGAILGEEMTLRLGVTITDARAVAEGIELVWEADGRSHRQVFAQVLAATGRRPNVDKLDLKAAGLTLDERGVPTFDPRSMRCGESAVFIAGDVNNHRPLLHEANEEGQIAGLNAARHAREPRQSPRAHIRRTPLTVVFTDPQIGLVGLTHRELAEREWSDRVAVGEVDYRDQGRARVMGQNRGVVRIYGDTSDGRLLGAEMAGPAVEHTAHLLAWAIQQRLTVVDALAMPFYHPCLEEGIRTALRDLAAHMAMVDPVEVRCIDCGPGS